MKTLIIIGHPDFSQSKAVKALLDTLPANADITVHDIAAAYPDGKIDIEKELALMEAHERVVLQFPIHWFGVPAVLKNWIDQVFGNGWTGDGGHRLNGKPFALAFTSGITADVYQKDKFGYTVNDLMNTVYASIHYVKGEFVGQVHIGGIPVGGAPDTESLNAVKDKYRKLVQG